MDIGEVTLKKWHAGTAKATLSRGLKGLGQFNSVAELDEGVNFVDYDDMTASQCQMLFFWFFFGWGCSKWRKICI